ncbi:TetR/AcrR family transcriptional regulator [Nocardia sp. NPDC127526]|uniref:TetR/AcrR family transcriptional regulator n=1 Tax=Nocardia sp. NPDC127526 TaxID=3345393 RepID=UPI00362AE92C
MGRPRNFEADTVVDRAMEAFWTHGYGNTSPAQLAEAAGVGKGSLYNTFGSKRELFDRALERYDRRGVEFCTEILNQPGTTRERLRAWMRFTVDSDLAEPVRRGCMMVNTAMELGGRDAEAMRAVSLAQEHMIEAFIARIQQGQRDGDVRADADPRATAEFLLNTIMGLRVSAKSSDHTTLYRIIDTALTAL